MYYASTTPVVTDSRNGKITIRGLPLKSLIRYTRKAYEHVGFMTTITISPMPTYITNSEIVVIYDFFVPELINVLEGARASGYARAQCTSIIDQLKTKTWFRSAHPESIPTKWDNTIFTTDINPELKPLPVQLEFIRDTYYQYKEAYNLNGYLLSLPPGSGKSLTSLFLYAGLHLKKLIVVAPLSTVNNVWLHEVEKCFVEKKVVATAINKEAITEDTEIVIINYEAIEKYTPLLKQYFTKDVMVIVDECHNFKDITSKRTVALIDMCETIGTNDILMMSGTPVKAFGTEALPILKLLANGFNDVIADKLKALQRYSRLMNELMCHRLGLMMFRRTKEEVVKLPPKYEHELLIKLPNGEKYTLPKVKEAMAKYREERLAYYASRSDYYNELYDSAMAYFHDYIMQHGTKEQLSGYNSYLKAVAIFRRYGFNPENAGLAHDARVFEDTTIIPVLPAEMKKNFREARTVVKYVELKVLGEVLGNLLGKLRMEMTSAMLSNQSIMAIIRDADKKTLMFSSYADTLRLAAEQCVTWGYRPMVIDGSNSKDAKELVAKFKADDNINPLIASLQVMSTGHTLNEANTVIFLNVPFRSVDYEQASDRCYRIGQDTEVHVYKLILDTGETPNLSTRMHDIVAWSREQFAAIVGDELEEINSLNSKPSFTRSPLVTTNNNIVEYVSNLITSLFSSNK